MDGSNVPPEVASMLRTAFGTLPDGWERSVAKTDSPLGNYLRSREPPTDDS